MTFEHDRRLLQIKEQEIEEVYASFRKNEMDKVFFKPENPFSIGENTAEGELRFRRIISYLYQLYMERGSVNMRIVADFATLADMKKDCVEKNKKIVHAFRTLFEHTLTSSKRDEMIYIECQTWMRLVLSHNEPCGEDWNVCAQQIYLEAENCLSMTRSILKRLCELNDSLIFDQWRVLQKQDIPHYKKIELIGSILDSYGFFCDADALYRKNQTAFNDVLYTVDWELSHLALLNNIKGRYEQIILRIDDWPCVLSGKEVGEYFDFEKSNLAKIMQNLNTFHKMELQKGHYCTKEELLHYIRETLINQG